MRPRGPTQRVRVLRVQSGGGRQMSGSELPALPPPCAATAEDVATVAMMAELLNIELGILRVGEGIRALGGEVEDDRYGAFVVRRDHRTLQRWLARAMALRARPRPRPTTTATAPSAARRETRAQPTATDPGGGDDDDGPPDGPIEAQGEHSEGPEMTTGGGARAPDADHASGDGVRLNFDHESLGPSIRRRILRRGLTPLAQRLAIWLLDLQREAPGGMVDRTVRDLAFELEHSPRSIKRGLRELRRAELLHVLEHPDRPGYRLRRIDLARPTGGSHGAEDGDPPAGGPLGCTRVLQYPGPRVPGYCARAGGRTG